MKIGRFDDLSFGQFCDLAKGVDFEVWVILMKFGYFYDFKVSMVGYPWLDC